MKKYPVLSLFIVAIAIIFAISCKKEEPILPMLSSIQITNITGNSALSGGNITSDGGGPIITRGVCWDTIKNPTIDNSITSDGVGIGVFSSEITGLSAGVTYYVRSYATNSVGTAYGDNLVFSTLSKPILNTSVISDVTLSSAVCGGNIVSDSGTPVTGRGVCWSTHENPTIDDSKTSDGGGTGLFNSNLTILEDNTTYYVRAYATNSGGTGYGNQINFTTNVLDNDGNLYHTINIGEQVWLVENLKVTHYRNGEAIPNIIDGSIWDTLTSGAYCYYKNDLNNLTIYGNLYNGYTVLDNRGVCPTGWHIPNSSEFEQLQNYLGGIENGGKLKEVGTTHWSDPNTGATNETGFTGLPGGFRMRHIFGTDGFSEIGLSASLWQKDISSTTSYRWILVNYSSDFYQGSYSYEGFDALMFGMSIRCLKD